MTITSTTLPGLLLIEPRKITDTRGFFSETFRQDTLAQHGIHLDFVQENTAFSAKPHTLRGLHFQTPPHGQAKLVRVTRGAIRDIVVDLRQHSPTYGQWLGFELSAENWQQLLIPSGFAHGYLTLKPDTEVHYKASAYYAPDADQGLLWNDPDLNIDWKLNGQTPEISVKDQTQPLFRDFTTTFLDPHD